MFACMGTCLGAAHVLSLAHMRSYEHLHANMHDCVNRVQSQTYGKAFQDAVQMHVCKGCKKKIHSYILCTKCPKVL